jgi:hypothetical protein
MINRKTGTAGMLLLFGYMGTHAQDRIKEPDYNKPRLFADFPQKISIDPTPFESILNTPEGRFVRVSLNASLVYTGTVISRNDAFDGSSKTVVIRSAERNGATFTITRIRKDNGGISYAGRILSFSHSDALELVQEEETWYLVKKHFYDIVND